MNDRLDNIENDVEYLISGPAIREPLKNYIRKNKLKQFAND
jgi:hypothetical protein